MHEKDLLIIDLEPGWEYRDGAFGEYENIDTGHARVPERVLDPVRLTEFAAAWRRGGRALVFMEGEPNGLPAEGEPNGLPADRLFADFSWLPGCAVMTSAVGADAHLLVAGGVDTYAGLREIFESQASGLRSARSLSSVRRSTPLLRNDANLVKALYQPIGVHGGAFLLPAFPRKAAALRRLLTDVLPQLSAPTSELFPVKGGTDWASRDAYQLRDVLAARGARRDAIKAHEERLAALEEEEKAARSRQESFLRLLQEGHEELRQAVMEALRWLEFDPVVDVDAERAAAKQNPVEDLRLGDDDGYSAVVEVTSAKGGAKDKDLMDLVKYQNLRREEVQKNGGKPMAIQGLLVMNQHVGTEPARRAGLYEGNPAMEGLAEAQKISLLSTWDLFRLVQRVDAGEIDRSAARKLIKTPGRIDGSAEPPR